MGTLYNRLIDEIEECSLTTNTTPLDDVDMSDIRGYIGSQNLKAILSGYDRAVMQTLHLPLRRVYQLSSDLSL
jgi:hypothetical protein